MSAESQFQALQPGADVQADVRVKSFRPGPHMESVVTASLPSNSETSSLSRYSKEKAHSYPQMCTTSSYIKKRPPTFKIEKRPFACGDGKVDWIRLGLRRGEKVARGSYAVVYRVDRPRADGGKDSVAAKVTATGGDESVKLHARQEYDMLKQVAHPHIIAVELFEEAAFETVVIMEYVPRGSLASSVRQHGLLSSEGAQQVAFGLFAAVKYLHERRAWHLDIKPDNLLLRADGNCVLCDFGSAQWAAETFSSGAVGTPAYAAPEAIANKVTSGDLLDMWGAGCCVWEATIGAVPWMLESEAPDWVNTAAFIERLEKFAEVEIPARRNASDCFDLPDGCWHLLQRCLAPKETRALVVEAVQNPWVKEVEPASAPTVAQRLMQRHNPYVGTSRHAPASPSMFCLDASSPWIVNPTRHERRTPFSVPYMTLAEYPSLESASCQTTPANFGEQLPFSMDLDDLTSTVTSTPDTADGSPSVRQDCKRNIQPRRTLSLARSACTFPHQLPELRSDKFSDNTAGNYRECRTSTAERLDNFHRYAARAA
jgi:serine/threonine protein kinase